MIYTLGHKATYDAGLAEMAAQGKSLLKGGSPKRDVGGSVWETREDAQAYIDSALTDPNRLPLIGFEVYGIDADWRRDTLKVANQPWRSLKRDAAVIKLETV